MRAPWLALVAAALALAAAIAALRDPAAAQRHGGRLHLALAGLRRRDREGRRGRLVVYEGGRGAPTVVLVHGYADSAGAWARVAARLRRHTRVVAVDLPGHGGSGPAAGDLSLDDLVDAVEDVVRAEPRPVVLVGHSLGGWVAARCARRAPERVAAVVLVHAAGLFPAVDDHVLLGRDRDEVRQLLGHLLPVRPRVPGVLLDGLGRHLRDPRLHALHADLRRRGMVAEGLEDLAVPVHLAWGPGDPFFPLDRAEAAARRLPRPTLHRLPPAGHIPSVLRPAEVARVVREVLATTG